MEEKISKTDIKYRKFAEAYVFGGEYKGEAFGERNAFKSYLSVYDEGGDMSHNSAGVSSSRLLRHPKIIAIIKEIEEAPLNYSIKKGEIIESNKEIRDKALKDRKYGDAIKANSEISRLMGFYEPEKVDNSGTITFTFGDVVKEEEEGEE